MKTILVTGGTGYIGSHCVVSLSKKGIRPIVVDNFSNSRHDIIYKIEQIVKKKIIFYKIDLRDKVKLNLIFKKHKIFSVIHCAGYKSITESIEKPIKYFDNNINSTLSLVDVMNKNKVYKLIFSSSATVYNQDQPLPWKENYKVGDVTSPYGMSKYLIENILKNISLNNKKLKIVIARYFNPISNHSSGLIFENPKGKPNNLMPYIVKVAQRKLPCLYVYGNNYPTRDGTCIRDYIHVMDLADGHVALLKIFKKINNFEIFNFGTGKVVSVLEIIKTFTQVTGINIPIKYTKRRKGDLPEFYCCPKKAKRILKWKSKRNLNISMYDIIKVLEQN
jgi:UDP-glucose 4-epimerase